MVQGKSFSSQGSSADLFFFLHALIVIFKSERNMLFYVSISNDLVGFFNKHLSEVFATFNELAILLR